MTWCVSRLHANHRERRSEPERIRTSDLRFVGGTNWLYRATNVAQPARHSPETRRSSYADDLKTTDLVQWIEILILRNDGQAVGHGSCRDPEIVDVDSPPRLCEMYAQARPFGRDVAVDGKDLDVT